VLFKGAAKIASVFLTATTVVVLLVLEHYVPSIIMPYATPFERFADVAFALPLCLLISATII
jgi:hypothetical protein